MPRNERYVDLQQALTAARARKGLTQQQVAVTLERPQSFVSKYESGERRLDVIEFLDVCSSIGITPVDILAKIGVNK